jgi:hypothetical protein
VGGATVQLIDQRPDWEKKPFIGSVCLYHLDKAHAWEKLAEDVDGVVADIPQKPERVDVVVTSFRLVRSGDAGSRYRDLSAGPNANPNVRSQSLGRNLGGDQTTPQGGNSPAPGADRPPVADGPPNKLELAFAAKDDPRRMLVDCPVGASCAIEATVRLTFPGGAERAVPVKTIGRAPNDADSGYWGQALDNATRTAVTDFGRQLRAGLGLGPVR